MPDRSLTPHELHQKAISVLDQLERIAVEWRSGIVPSPGEIDVITSAVTALRARTEDVARETPDTGRSAIENLSGARRRIAEAIRLVDELAAEHPGRVPVVPRVRAFRSDADPFAGA